MKPEEARDIYNKHTMSREIDLSQMRKDIGLLEDAGYLNIATSLKMRLERYEKPVPEREI